MPGDVAGRRMLHGSPGAAQLTVFIRDLRSSDGIALRLPRHLWDAIKTAAKARDGPYQSLIEVWLQEKVRRS